MKSLIHQTELAIKRLRWRTIFFLEETNKATTRDGDPESSSDESNSSSSPTSEEEGTPKNTYGFKSSATPGFVKELAGLEKDWWKLIDSVKFTQYRSKFQNKLKADCDSISKSSKILISADKTRNIYDCTPEVYNNLITNEICRNYRRTEEIEVSKINYKAKSLAKSLGLDDRIEAISKKESFISLKDHKQNFQHDPKCRLINPTKSEMGLVAQKILQRVNAEIRETTKLKQWRNSKQVIDWYNSLEDKKSMVFMQCDIVEFYPSIKEKLLKKALKFAKRYSKLTEKEEEVIFQARDTVLFKDGEPWRKNRSFFDVSMGAYDGAEISELVGLLALKAIDEQLPHLNFGLYRDDGLATYKADRGAKTDSIRKSLIRIFNSLDLRITVEFNLHRVDFLDITFDLAEMTYQPYRKPNDTPCYIDVESNHPDNVKKQLPKMISERLSNISSSQQIFEDAADTYNKALKKGGYQEKVKFITRERKETKRGRAKKVVWYNPPFNAAVTTNLGKQFLALIDKHFPNDKPREDKLHKIINRHTLKLSYSCTANMSNIIAGHNAKVLRANRRNGNEEEAATGCNCQKPESCPMPGRCKEETLVYEATIETPTETKRYIGSTELSFKKRYYGHSTDLSNPPTEESKGGTTLSAYYWQQKEKGHKPVIKWTILKKCQKYRAGSRKCDVCLTEKLLILKSKYSLLNKRTELMYKCPHARKHRLQMAEKPG